MRKKGGRGTKFLFPLAYLYLEGLDYDEINIFYDQNLEKSRCTRNVEEMMLFSAIKYKSLASDDVKIAKIWAFSDS